MELSSADSSGRCPAFFFQNLGAQMPHLQKLVETSSSAASSSAHQVSGYKFTCSTPSEDSAFHHSRLQVTAYRLLYMMSQTYEKYSADQVTPAMLEDAALLFNEHYGTWGTDPSSSISTGKKGTLRKHILFQGTKHRTGSPVKLSRDRLKKEYLPDNARCSYVTVTIGSRLAGNAFACRWSCDGLVVCWVTQLVIHKEFRERGLAGSLLNALRESTDGAYGLMSSHPAACLAAAKAFGGEMCLPITTMSNSS